jgi:2-polyprenyl-3-methyl-5-hydroxy-6-metoxy-1,4-benzoquinol methylase
MAEKINYSDIYNKEYTENVFYQSPGSSPGFLLSKRLNDLNFFENSRVIADIGCGSGFTLSYISTINDGILYGFDVSDVAISRGRKDFPNINFTNSKDVNFLDLLNFISEKDSNIDTFICFDMIEHLDKDDALVFLTQFLNFIESDKFPSKIKNLAISISLRLSSKTDDQGVNLHRTVETKEWWLEKINKRLSRIIILG